MDIGQEYEQQLQTYAQTLTHINPATSALPNRAENIDNLLTKSVVCHLQDMITDEVNKNCYGCQVHHPSQKQHDLCLMTSKEDLTYQFIDSALMNMDPYKIMEDWYPKIQSMDMDDKEHLFAYRLWKHTKEDIEQNKRQLITELWSSWWCNRVLEAWQ